MHGGLTVAGIHQLIEHRDADHERDLRSMATPKSDISARQCDDAHQALLWNYQMALASVATLS